VKSLRNTTKQIKMAGEPPEYKSVPLPPRQQLGLTGKFGFELVFCLYADSCEKSTCIGNRRVIFYSFAVSEPGLCSDRPIRPCTLLSSLVWNAMVITAYQWDKKRNVYTLCLFGHVVWTRQSGAHFRLRAQNN
jgi:hypothetical protein